MAIRLASAIGEQRKPIDVLGGVGDAIGKVGDTIIKGINDGKAKEAKRAEQDQKFKEALLNDIEVGAIDALPEQQMEYENFAKNGYTQIMQAAYDPKMTSSQIKKMKDDFVYGLAERKIKYGNDLEAIHDVTKKLDTHDTGRFDSFLIGKEAPTQVAEMPNGDFMATSEADRAGKMVGEEGMQATETETKYQGKNYLTLPFEEQKKIDLREKVNTLVTPKRVGVEKASKGYFGEDFDFQNLTKRTDKVNPTTGEYIFEFDKGNADLMAKKFASSMIGDGNFGSKDHSIQQKAYETEALIAGNDAGFSGQKLADFVEETVAQRAYDDFMKAALTANQKRMMNDKDITKAPSKGGFSNNITLGGGGSNAKWNISKPKEIQLREGATREVGSKKLVKGKEGNLNDYDYFAIETVSTTENPVKISIGDYADVQLNGVLRDKKTGEITQAKVTKKATDRADAETVFVPITKESELLSIKTNIGEDDFEKATATGKYKPTKATPKKEAAKEVKKQEDLRKKYNY